MRHVLISLFMAMPCFSLAQQNMSEPGQFCRDGHKHSQAIERIQSIPVGYTIPKIVINVDTIDFSGQSIRASANVTVAATSPIITVNLDLLGFIIDSVVINQQLPFFSYNDTLLAVSLPGMMNPGDTSVISVYYRGQPAQDASGWGGFYFNGSYAFNLGVGFAANPHCYGRAWYPCVDDFTTRSTYEFFITTPATLKAFCNGVLQNEIVNPNGTKTWHWKIDQTIPSYLVSMAVGPYHTLQRTSSGLPVEWAAAPADTNLVLATFANLDTTLSRFISGYGPYPFDKVGYCLVPFNSGAMEHAASIHIGRAYIDGSQTYATLWAHELSHMWWGDKVTCSTEADMWLNEGFASYNEAWYTQFIYGQTAYKDWIRTNHRRQLQFAHTPVGDGSYLTLDSIPHTNTYGAHVYLKGADIVHTLRNYMGDQSFFTGCQTYMNNLAYNGASSADLRDQLTAGTGINMNRFFEDWISTPGWSHFSIDSVVYIPGGLDHYWVYTRQRNKGNSHIYEMPVDITFSNGIDDTTVTVVIDSATNVFHIPLIIVADWIALDRGEKVSDAIVDYEKVITATGTQVLTETTLTLNVQTLSAVPSTVRAEHNFVPPDPFKQSNPGIRLADYHYWKVDGIFNNGFLSKGTFNYDGSLNSSTGYLDNTFITTTEDSLVILYRAGTWDDWQLVNGFSHFTGPSLMDKRGNFTVDTLKRGEYTFGIYDYTVGFSEVFSNQSASLNVYPNPSGAIFNIVLPETPGSTCKLSIFDNGGRIIREFAALNPGNTVQWDASAVASGIYVVSCNCGEEPAIRQKLIFSGIRK